MDIEEHIKAIKEYCEQTGCWDCKYHDNMKRMCKFKQNIPMLWEAEPSHSIQDLTPLPEIKAGHINLYDQLIRQTINILIEEVKRLDRERK